MAIYGYNKAIPVGVRYTRLRSHSKPLPALFSEVYLGHFKEYTAEDLKSNNKKGHDKASLQILVQRKS